MHSLLANKIGALATAVADRTSDAFGEQRSGSSVAVLQTLLYWGPITGTELAKIIGVSQPTMVRVVGGLIREGLVKRHHKQGRNIALELSRVGRAEAKRLRRCRLTEVAKLVSALNAGQARSLENLVDLLLASATDGRAKARRICRFCAHDVCEGPVCPVGLRATILDGELKEKRRANIRA